MSDTETINIKTIREYLALVGKGPLSNDLTHVGFWYVLTETERDRLVAGTSKLVRRGRKELLDGIVEYLEGAAEQCRLYNPQHTQAYRKAATVVARLLDEEAKT